MKTIANLLPYLILLITLPASAVHNRPIAPPADGGVAHLVKDINPLGNPGNFLRASPLVPLGDVAYFLGGTQEGSISMYALWRTDGTPDGTRRVRDFINWSGPAPTGLVQAGGKLFFFAGDADTVYQVWTSDGTAIGTLPLIAVGPSYTEPYSLAVVGSVVYFLRRPGPGIAVELWTSSGTCEGTRRVAAFTGIATPYDVGGLASWGGRLAFRGWDAQNGSELWISDGTPEGTRILKDVNPGGPGSSLDTLTVWGSRLFFVASTGDTIDREVWVSDGTEAGTVRVAGPPQMSSAYALTPAGGLLYFQAISADNQSGLWRTDGTPGGTVFLGNLDVLWWETLLMAPVSGGTVLFSASDRISGYELWRSDGTPQGTSLLRDIAPGSADSTPTDLVAWNGRVYFSASAPDTGAELWSSDGSADGTVLFRDINPGPAGSFPQDLDVWNGLLWFEASDDVHGSQPWISDGTPKGTRLLAVLASDAASSDIQSLIPWGADEILLEADDGTHGMQVWSSDGTSEGTLPLTDLVTDNPWYPPGPLLSSGIQAFFAAYETDFGYEPWVTDGTPAGTRRIADIVPGPASSLFYLDQRGTFLNGIYYYSGSDGVHGLEPWRTDGTASGTRMVADLCVSPTVLNTTASSWPENFSTMGGLILFTARGQDATLGLYAADGTAGGTRRLATFPESGEMDVQPPTVSGDLLFLFQRNGYSWMLWRSDGSVEGTYVAASLPVASDTWWSPGPLFPMDGRVFFSASSDAGNELWTSDGSRTGTFPLKDINPGAGDSFPADFAALGDHFYFRADDSVNGAELWTSDGTTTGTRMLKDLCPGLCSGYPMHLFSDGRHLFFSATDGVHGYELWMSDGTAEGTQLVADIQPGPGSSAPEQITPSGSTVYFVADDGVTGRELWRFDMPTP